MSFFTKRCSFSLAVTSARPPAPAAADSCSQLSFSCVLLPCFQGSLLQCVMTPGDKWMPKSTEDIAAACLEQVKEHDAVALFGWKYCYFVLASFSAPPGSAFEGRPRGGGRGALLFPFFFL